jgi:hypothetical protein
LTFSPNEGSVARVSGTVPGRASSRASAKHFVRLEGAIAR